MLDKNEFGFLDRNVSSRKHAKSLLIAASVLTHQKSNLTWAKLASPHFNCLRIYTAPKKQYVHNSLLNRSRLLHILQQSFWKWQIWYWYKFSQQLYLYIEVRLIASCEWISLVPHLSLDDSITRIRVIKSRSQRNSPSEHRFVHLFYIWIARTIRLESFELSSHFFHNYFNSSLVDNLSNSPTTKAPFHFSSSCEGSHFTFCSILFYSILTLVGQPTCSYFKREQAGSLTPSAPIR